MQRLSKRAIEAAAAGLVFGATLAGCGGSRTLVIRSDVPAVFDRMSGPPDCTGLECRIEISRETCWFFDSSRGYVVIQATTPTARLRAPALTTCDIRDGTLLTFSFTAPVCTVWVQEPGRRAQRFVVPCEPAGPPGRS